MHGLYIECTGAFRGSPFSPKPAVCLAAEKEGGSSALFLGSGEHGMWIGVSLVGDWAEAVSDANCVTGGTGSHRAESSPAEYQPPEGMQGADVSRVAEVSEKAKLNVIYQPSVYS